MGSTTAVRPSTFPMEQVKGTRLQAICHEPFGFFLDAAFKGSNRRVTFTVTAEGVEYTTRVVIKKATATDATGFIFRFEGVTGARRKVEGTCTYDPRTLAFKTAGLTFLR